MDAHSKWPEVEVMSSTTSGKTIEVLRSMFARHGLPEQLVSDNGPQFTSAEFEQFLKGNQMKHILSAPYHPSSNGLAERFVQTLKRTLKASEKDGKTIHHRLAKFLFEYCATPHTTTNVSPSELFQKRKLRTRFDLMMPNTKSHVISKQADQKAQHDSRVKSRSLFPGTPVMVRDYRGPDKWIPGIILKKLGPVTYSVEVTQGRIMKRHIDQLRLREDSASVTTTPSTTPTDSIMDDYPDPDSEETPTPQDPQLAQTPEQRYPQRKRHPPDRFMRISDEGHSDSRQGGEMRCI